MEYVVDTSVVFKLHFPEPRAEKVRALLRHNPDVMAPEFILAEFANAIGRKARRGMVSEAYAERAVEKLAGQITRRFPDRELIQPALKISMALNHPIYDCFHLALADREGAQLITDDLAFYNKVAQSPWRNHIVLLAECDVPEG